MWWPKRNLSHRKRSVPYQYHLRYYTTRMSELFFNEIFLRHTKHCFKLSELQSDHNKANFLILFEGQQKWYFLIFWEYSRLLHFIGKLWSTTRNKYITSIIFWIFLKVSKLPNLPCYHVVSCTVKISLFFTKLQKHWFKNFVRGKTMTKYLPVFPVITKNFFWS